MPDTFPISNLLMNKLRSLKYLVAIILLVFIAQGCSQPGQPAGTQVKDAQQKQIDKLIADGRRLENINNDSLGIVSKNLADLQKQTGDKRALAYSELFDALYLWQASDHAASMGIAIKCLNDAKRYNIRPILPPVYALIGNLHKETTNYAMAFVAADSGLNAAIANKDTAQIIALLGLKAMFKRGYNLKRHMPRLKSDSSLLLNLEALKLAESKPQYERLRIRFYTNIGQFYIDQGNLDSAFYYETKSVALANKYNQQRSLTYSLCWLGKAYCLKGDSTKGIAYLNQALQIAKNIKEPYREMEINETFFDVYRHLGNYWQSLHYFNVYRDMKDSLKVLDNVKQISELQIKYETVQKDQKISELKSQSKITSLQLNIFAILLVSVVVISILFSMKEKKHKDLLFSEKCRVDIELKNATMELAYFTDNLKQKNELIEEFKTKIEHLHQQNTNRSDIEGLDILVKEHIMTDESWDNFKRLFTKVHASFFNVLSRKYPNLTTTDTRMLSLIRLKLSNYEMANMLGVTTEGVKKSKQRLRKKMNLHPEQNLEQLVESL